MDGESFAWKERKKKKRRWRSRKAAGSGQKVGLLCARVVLLVLLLLATFALLFVRTRTRGVPHLVSQAIETLARDAVELFPRARTWPE